MALENLPSSAVRITDRDDPRIALFRNVRERDLVGRQGIFIAEGASVLRVLLRSSIEALAILVEEGRAARMDWLSDRGAAPLYVAPQSVVDAVAGFHLHRGILGAGRIPQGIEVSDLPAGVLRLPVLIGLSNHDNVGGIFRNAAAFGAAAVALDGGTADPFYRKAIRVGVGAPLVVPTIRTDDPLGLMDLLRSHDIAPYALTPGAGTAINDAVLAPRAAFFLGTEGPGLPENLLDATTRLSIAMAGGFDSLNVATASGIALHAHAASHGFGRSLTKPSALDQLAAIGAGAQP
ncbi:MAG: RNA methyltransferase [Pseudomonadota bacterium]